MNVRPPLLHYFVGIQGTPHVVWFPYFPVHAPGFHPSMIREPPGFPKRPVIDERVHDRWPDRLEPGARVGVGPGVYRYEPHSVDSPRSPQTPSVQPSSPTPRPNPRTGSNPPRSVKPPKTRPLSALVLQGVSPWLKKKSRIVKSGTLMIGQSQRWLRAGGLRVEGDPHVRLVHAEIAQAHDGHYVHPYAPTFVNGKAIFRPTKLRAGDRLTVGASTFVVKRGARFMPSAFRPVPSPAPTFSIDRVNRVIDLIRSPQILHHPHLREIFTSANILPEGRALRWAQLLAEQEANRSFLKGEGLVMPDDSYDFCLKHNLRQQCAGRIRQPDFLALPYRGRSSHGNRMDVASEHARSAARFLEENRTVYLKPSGSSLSFGLARLSLGSEGLEVYSRHSGFLRSLSSAAPSVRQKSANRLVIPLGARRSTGTAVASVLKSYADVMRSSVGADVAVMERGIDIPKLGNKTWEIRNYHQAVGDQRKLTYQYAKVGAGSVIAAVGLGGSRADAHDTVSRVYKARYPGDSAGRIQQKVEAFFKELNRESAKTVAQLQRALQDHVQNKSGRYPLGDVDIHHLVVDFTGEFDEHGVLRPVLIEANKVGSLHANVREHRVARKNLERMIEREQGRMRRLFRTSAADSTPPQSRLR